LFRGLWNGWFSKCYMKKLGNGSIQSAIQALCRIWNWRNSVLNMVFHTMKRLRD